MTETVQLVVVVLVVVVAVALGVGIGAFLADLPAGRRPGRRKRRYRGPR